MVERSYDVVICGYGGAGAAAAIEAHDHGARALIVEKSSEGGGSTLESGGSIATIVDPAGAVEHYLALTEGRTPREVIEAYVAGVIELQAWVASNGGEFESLAMHRPPFPHRYEGTAYETMTRSDAIGRRVRIAEPGTNHGGTTLWNFLQRNVTERGIDVRYRSAARRLMTESGSLTGVELHSAKRPVRIGAASVILTCGGFACDEKLLRDAVGPGFAHLSPPSRNTGDGVRMAQAVGADLWHMNCVAAGFGYQVPGMEAAWMCSIPAFGFFMVDRNGHRFMNEPTVEHHAANHVLAVREFRTGDFLRMPSYLLFDETTRRSGPIATREAGHNRHSDWSADNRAEVEKGWIARADTPNGLGSALGLPEDVIADAVSRYNDGCRSGDDEFGRHPDTLVALDEPPFYGIEVRPSLFNTQGGPRRNERGQILDAGGDPIGGLYGAGELGSLWAALYPGAGNVTEALVSGRIAGSSAAAADRPAGRLTPR